MYLLQVNYDCTKCICHRVCVVSLHEPKPLNCSATDIAIAHFLLLLLLLQVLSMYSSSYVLIAASIDRFLAICHPLRFHASIVARQPFLVVAAWVPSSILTPPQ